MYTNNFFDLILITVILCMIKLTTTLNSLKDKIESIQYKVALAIAGALTDFSREKLYQELGLQILQQKWCIEDPALLTKFFKS